MGSWFLWCNTNQGIEGAYLDGISLTRGVQGSRQHIWSFVRVTYEQHPNYPTGVSCPCTNTAAHWPYQIRSFIYNNYFCDTCNPGLVLTLLDTTLTTLCGMDKDVVAIAPVVSSILRHSFVLPFVNLLVIS